MTTENLEATQETETQQQPLLDQTPPDPATPVSETGPSESVAQAPAWWDGIETEQRASVLDAMLRSMPAEELGKIPSLTEQQQQAASRATAEAQEHLTRTSQEQEATNRLIEAASTFVQRAEKGEVQDWNQEVRTISQAASIIAETKMSQGLSKALERVGIKDLPPQFTRAIENSKGLDETIFHYGMLIAGAAGSAGTAKGKSETAAAQKANETVLRTKLQAELVEQGWTPPRTPPSITGRTPAAAGGMTLDEIEAMPTSQWLSYPKEQRDKLLESARSR